MVTHAVVLILLLVAIGIDTVTDDQNEKPILSDNQVVIEREPKLSVAGKWVEWLYHVDCMLTNAQFFSSVLVLIAIFITASCVAIMVIAFRSLNAIKTVRN